MNTIFTILFCAAAVIFSAPADTSETTETVELSVNPELRGVITKNAEPCVWTITVGSGRKAMEYHPTNLSEEFQQDGLQVIFKYTMNPHVKPICDDKPRINILDMTKM